MVGALGSGAGFAGLIRDEVIFHDVCNSLISLCDCVWFEKRFLLLLPGVITDWFIWI